MRAELHQDHRDEGCPLPTCDALRCPLLQCRPQGVQYVTTATRQGTIQRRLSEVQCHHSHWKEQRALPTGCEFALVSWGLCCSSRQRLQTSTRPFASERDRLQLNVVS